MSNTDMVIKISEIFLFLITIPLATLLVFVFGLLFYFDLVGVQYLTIVSALAVLILVAPSVLGVRGAITLFTIILMTTIVMGMRWVFGNQFISALLMSVAVVAWCRAMWISKNTVRLLLVFAFVSLVFVLFYFEMISSIELFGALLIAFTTTLFFSWIPKGYFLIKMAVAPVVSAFVCMVVLVMTPAGSVILVGKEGFTARTTAILALDTASTLPVTKPLKLLSKSKLFSRVAKPANSSSNILSETQEIVISGRGGRLGKRNPLNYPLSPNTVYTEKKTGYKYRTDGQGRVVEVEGNLRLGNSDRSSYQQSISGGSDRLVSDEGGHLIAARFNGPGDGINLVPMNSNLNRSRWKAMEDGWADELRKGNSVSVKIKPMYYEASVRPHSFQVEYSVGSNRPQQVTFINGPASQGGT